MTLMTAFAPTCRLVGEPVQRLLPGLERHLGVLVDLAALESPRPAMMFPPRPRDLTVMP